MDNESENHEIVEIEPRALRSDERAILEYIIAADFPGADDLAQQLAAVSVVGEFRDGSIRLAVDENRAPRADVPRGVPVVQATDDRDVTTEIQLHVADGYLYALDFYNYEDDPRVGVVDVTSLRRP